MPTLTFNQNLTSTRTINSKTCTAIAVVAGDTIVLHIVFSSATGTRTIATPTDSQGNTYAAPQAQITPNNSVSAGHRVYYAVASATGNVTVTATVNGTAACDCECFVTVLHGAGTLNSSNQGNNGGGSSLTLATGNVTAVAGGIVVSSFVYWAGGLTTSTNRTLVADDAFYMAIDKQLPTVGGTTSSTWTQANSGLGSAIILSFAPSGLLLARLRKAVL